MDIEISIAETHGLDGVVTLAAEGQPDVVITDEPWHQLMHLCSAVAEFEHGMSAGIPYSSMPGGYQLSVDGDEVVLTGDYVPTVRYPRAELATAIIAATDVWLAHAAALPSVERDGVRESVAEAADAARAAVRPRPEPTEKTSDVP